MQYCGKNLSVQVSGVTGYCPYEQRGPAEKRAAGSRQNELESMPCPLNPGDDDVSTVTCSNVLETRPMAATVPSYASDLRVSRARRAQRLAAAQLVRKQSPDGSWHGTCDVYALSEALYIIAQAVSRRR